MQTMHTAWGRGVGGGGGVGGDLLERLPVGRQGLLSAGDVHKGDGGALHGDSARLVNVNATRGCEKAKRPSPAALAAPVALLLEASSPSNGAAAAAATCRCLNHPFIGCCWDLW